MGASVFAQHRVGSARYAARQALALSLGADNLGFWSGLVSAGCALAFTLLAFAPTVFGVPAGTFSLGFDVYARGFTSAQMLLLVPLLVAAPAFVALVAAVHAAAPASRRAWSGAALGLAVVYAAIIGTNYYAQLTVVRYLLLTGQTAGLALFTMADARSLFWMAEAIGYGFQSLAMLAVLPALPANSGTVRGRWVRGLFAANGVSGLLGIAVYGYTMDGFHPTLLVGLAVWCVVMPVASLLLAVELRRTDEVRL